MRDINRLYSFDASKTCDLGVDTVKAAVRLEHALPGILLITRHVVVGVVACNNHQGTENHFLEAFRFDFFDDLVTGSLLGLALDGSDKDIGVCQRIHHGLHLAVGHLCGVRGAVAHENNSGAVHTGFRNALISRILNSLCNDCLCNGFFIFIDDRRILADFAQQGLRDADSLKITCDSLNGIHELIILSAMHQVCGLNDKILDAVFLRAGQSLVDVVDDLTVTGLHMVDDDLGSKCPAHGPVGVGFLQSLLDAADICRAALIEGSAEAHDQKLVLADIIRIERIVRRGIAGIAAEVIGIRLFAFHHCFLFIRQGIPCSPRRGNVRVCCLCAFLHIDLVDQSCALCRKLFIRFCHSCSFCRSRTLCCSICCRCALYCRCSFTDCLGRVFRRLRRCAVSRTAAACQKCARQSRCQQDRCQFLFHVVLLLLLKNTFQKTSTVKNISTQTFFQEFFFRFTFSVSGHASRRSGPGGECPENG